MTSISKTTIGVARPAAAERALEASKVQKVAEEAQSRPPKPAMDEYVQSKPQETTGRYWLGKDEDSQPKIYFDSQPQADIRGAENPKPDQGAKGGEQDELWVMNTDRVDREIEKLKQKQQEVEQRLSAETDQVKIKELEQRIAQIERELSQKDNDTYRKQHSTFTRLS